MVELTEGKLIGEKVNSFVYKSTIFDKNGWADAKKFRPIPFDLVVLKTSEGSEFSGWWNKFQWEGLRLRQKHKITHWKRRIYEQIL